MKGLVYFQDTLGGPVARAWPKKRGKPKSQTTILQNTLFAETIRALPYIDPGQRRAAEAIAAGTAYTWRDVMFMAMHGNFAEIIGLEYIPPPIPPEPEISMGLFSEILGPIPTMEATGLTETLNPGSAIFADDPTGISIEAPASSGDSLRCLYMEAPDTPYRYRGLVSFHGTFQNFQSCGLGWTDLTKLITVVYEFANGWRAGNIVKWNTTTSFNSGGGYAAAAPPLSRVWFELEADANTIYFRLSVDGSRYRTTYFEDKSTGWLGASGYSNLVFFCNRNNNDGSSQAIATLESFQRVA